jgi:hypothetical protein
MLLDLVIGLIIWLQTEIKQISLHPLILRTTTGGLIRDAHGKFICDHFYNRLGVAALLYE